MQSIKFGQLNLLKTLLVVAIAFFIILVSTFEASARYGSGSQNPKKKPTPTVTPRAPRCGNNQCDPGETCDGAVYCVVGGGAIYARSCRNDNAVAECTFCGDGIVQRSAGETCDDGNYDDNDVCSNSCRTRVLGTTTSTPAPTRRPTLVRTGISLVVPFSLGIASLGILFAINKKKI
jgi:cysteine-rich repeat protein